MWAPWNTFLLPFTVTFNTEVSCKAMQTLQQLNKSRDDRRKEC